MKSGDLVKATAVRSLLCLTQGQTYTVLATWPHDLSQFGDKLPDSFVYVTVQNDWGMRASYSAWRFKLINGE